MRSDGVVSLSRYASRSPSLSYSEMRSFGDCRKAWDYRYRQNLEPVREGGEVRVKKLIGEAGHAALKSYYEGQRSLSDLNIRGEEGGRLLKKVNNDLHLWRSFEVERQDLWPEEEERYETVTQLVTEIMIRYHELYQEDRWEVVAIEQHFEIKLPGVRRRFVGYWDLIIKDANGLYWVVDHKWTNRFRNEADLEMDLQIGGYEWAANHLGLEIVGTIYNQIKPMLPAEPELLQSGKGLRQSEITTDYATYAAALDRHGFPHGPYEKFLEKLKGKEFFRRTYINRTPEESVSFYQDMLLRAREMNKKGVPVYRTPNPMNCPNCPFLALCSEESRGREGSVIAELEYQPRTRRSETYMGQENEPEPPIDDGLADFLTR